MVAGENLDRCQRDLGHRLIKCQINIRGTRARDQIALLGYLLLSGRVSSRLM